MNLLEQILSKQTLSGPNTPNHKDRKIKPYKILYSDFMGTHQYDNYKSESSHHHYNWRTIQKSKEQHRFPRNETLDCVVIPRKSHQYHQSGTINYRKTVRNFNNLYKADYDNSQNRQFSLPKRQFFVTIYSRNERWKNSSPHYKKDYKSTKQLNQIKDNLQLQVNRLPIVRKKELKRRIIAEANQRFYNPPEPIMPKNKESPLPTAQLGEEKDEREEMEEKIQISGWESTDPLEQ